MNASSGPLTRDEAEKLLQRTTDQGWIEGHRANPNGEAVLNSFGDIGEAASRATIKQCEAGTISLAPGGRAGVCTLKAKRTDATLPDTITIPKGYKFRTDLGFNLLLTEDVIVIQGQTDLSFPLATERKIDLVNTFDPAFDPLMQPTDFLGLGVHVDSPDITYPSDPTKLLIGSYLNPRPPAPAPTAHTLIYVSSTGIEFAECDWISVLGNERGQKRQANEDVEAYRARVRNIPDAVSPIAIEEAANAAASQAKLPTIWLLEPSDDGADATVRAEHDLSVMDGPFCDAADSTGKATEYLDDPFGQNKPFKFPFRNYELQSIREGRAYFRLSMNGLIQNPDDLPFFVSEGTEGVPMDYLDDPIFGYLDVGLEPELATHTFGICMHPALQRSFLAVTEEASRKRAGGVNYDFYIENATILHANGEVLIGGASVVWMLDAPTGLGWLLREGLASAIFSVSAPNETWDLAVNGHTLRFTFSDGSIFDTPTWVGPDSEHLTTDKLISMGFPFGKPIVSIWGTVIGDGINKLNLDGTFWVDVFTL